MVVEAEGLPIGSLLPIHATPLVAQEANLEKDKKMVGQPHYEARTDAEIVVIAGGYFYEKGGARNCEQSIDRLRQYYDRGQGLSALNVFDVIDVVKDSSLRSE